MPNTEIVNQSEAREAFELIRKRAQELGIRFNWNTLKAERDADRP